MKSLYLLAILLLAIKNLSAEPVKIREKENQLRQQIGDLIQHEKNSGPRFTVAGIIEKLQHNFLIINGEKIIRNESEKIIGNLVENQSARARGKIVDGEKILQILIIQDPETQKMQEENNSDSSEAPNQIDGMPPELLDLEVPLN